MKRLLLSVFLLFIPIIIFSQTNNDKKIYLDSIGNTATETDYYYLKVIKDYHKIKDAYNVEIYYKSGQIEMEGVYLDKECTSKNGEFVFYYENGNKNKVTHFKKSIEIGEYNSWYKNGNKRVEGEFLKNDKYDGFRGELKVNQFWDTENAQKVIDGNGYYEEIGSTGKYSGKIKKGLKDSIWSGNDKKYKISYIENYKKGNLISGRSTDENGLQFQYEDVFKPIYSTKGLQDFYNYISKNFKMPENIKNGKIILRFWVNSDSTITDVRILKGYNPKVDQQAKIIISTYPYWKPALYRGIKTDSYYTIPINFYENNMVGY